MSFATKRNKGSKFNINTEGFEFRKLAQLKEDTVYPVYGVTVFRTRFGDSPAAILSDCFVNLPKHMSEDIFSILEDDSDIADINAGKVGLKLRRYTGKDGNQYIGCEWVDIK